MDVQLQELIDKIKTEGVEKAREKAEELVEEAQTRADGIIADAERRADEIVRSAEQQAEQSLQSGRDALRQAARDLMIGLKQRIERLFATVLEKEVSAAFHGDVLERAILQVVDTLGEEHLEDAEFLLSEEDAQALSERLREGLAGKLKSGFVVTPSARISAGFRVSVEGGTAHYDFSPEEIAEVLTAFLSPRLQEIVEEGAREDESGE